MGALDERLPPGLDSLGRAAWAGLQDSMPRAALLSIHARVHGTEPSAWEDPALVQVWGPRFSAYVVAAADVAVFTLGRLPDDPSGLRRAVDTATRLESFLGGRRMNYSDAGHALGMHPNALRYGAPTGRILIRWEGARRPTIWTVPPPDVDPFDARLELARRYFDVLGPGTAATFGGWAGIKPQRARAAFDALAGSPRPELAPMPVPELTPVRTPIGDAWILAADEESFRAAPGASASPARARLLPSGDAYYLLQGRDRELLVPDADRRAELWTSRVWPGAVLVEGEIVGTWRRASADLTIDAWRRLSGPEREAVEAEAASLPLPDVAGRIRVRWAP